MRVSTFPRLASLTGAALGLVLPLHASAASGPGDPLLLHVDVAGSAGAESTVLAIPLGAHVAHAQNGPRYRVHFSAVGVDACHVVLTDLRYAPHGTDLAPAKAVLPPLRVNAGRTLTTTSSDSLRVDLRLEARESCASEVERTSPDVPRQGGTVAGTCLGLMPVALADARRSERARDDWELPDAVPGVVVWSVAPRSPAAAAGVRTGDVIATFNGEPVELPSTLSARVAALAAGDPFQLVVLRRGESSVLEGALGERITTGRAQQCLRRAGTAATR